MTNRIQDYQLGSYRAGLVALSGFASAGGASDNVSTALATLLSTCTRQGAALPAQSAVLTSGSEAEGVITSTPLNKVAIRGANDQHIVDANGNDVYGRITLAGAVWTVTYYSMAGGTETAYTGIAAGTALTMLMPCLFQLFHYPYSADLMVEDLSVDSELGLVGKRPFAANLAITTANTVPNLPQAAVGEVHLVINGINYSSLDTNPAFIVSGNAVTWSAANSFTLAVGSNVVAYGTY